jgi:small-conductance mechanosensitive channel
MLSEYVDLIGPLGVIVLPFLVIFLSVVLAYLSNWIIRRWVLRFAAKTKTTLDDRLIKILQRPIFFGTILLGFLISIGILKTTLSEESMRAVNFLNKLLLILLTGIGAFAVVKLIDLGLLGLGVRLAKRTQTRLDDEVIPFLSKVLKVMVFAGAFVLVLNILGYTIGSITSVIAGLGIVGFAVGFASKDTLENILAGFFILADRPFAKGDRIQIGEHVGDVVDIGLRTTKIKTLDSLVVIVPNSKVITQEVINYERPKTDIKVVIKVGVAYGSDVDRVKEILLDVGKGCEYVVDSPEPSVCFREFGDSSLNFELRVWVGDFRKRLRAIDFINTEIDKRFKEEGIEIPFPIRTLYMRKEG